MYIVDKKMKDVADLLSVDISNALVVVPSYYGTYINQPSDCNHIWQSEYAITIVDSDYIQTEYISKHEDLLSSSKGNWELLNICDKLNSQISDNILLSAYYRCRNRERDNLDTQDLLDYINSISYDRDTAHIVLNIWQSTQRVIFISDTSNISNLDDKDIRDVYDKSELYIDDATVFEKFVNYSNHILNTDDVLNEYDALVRSIIKKDLTDDEVVEILNIKLDMCDDIQKYAICQYCMRKYSNYKLEISEPHRTISIKAVDRKLTRKILRYRKMF